VRFQITDEDGETTEVHDVAMAQLEAESRARAIGVNAMDSPMLATVAMAYASHQIYLHGSKRAEWEPWDDWAARHQVSPVDDDAEAGPTDAAASSD
jgi:hypothetical protein